MSLYGYNYIGMMWDKNKVLELILEKTLFIIKFLGMAAVSSFVIFFTLPNVIDAINHIFLVNIKYSLSYEYILSAVIGIVIIIYSIKSILKVLDE